MGLQMKRQSKWLKASLLSLVLLLAAGCRHYRGDDMYDDDEGGGVGDVSHFYGEHVTREQEMELLSQDTFYFSYDGYDLAPGDVLAVYAHARKLLKHPGASVRIEGHTDERGSREYNVALGERRAKAVAQILMSKGVPSHQIHVMSYGKEKPVAFGHDESAWKQNRRALIVYESE